ncbi:DUF5672 family protein [Mucilaginibacter yixingensis]|uniref:DUF5672 family protein n=1 Tax=Mucilaginibacter yixingensis TaxID=1295612 RepID=UPI0011B27C16|nr:DUF5672 family protein [Mucilaginibacter yixingensis]
MYKDIPSHNEIISLRQCLSVLGHYPIEFVGPASLNTASYCEFCSPKTPFNYNSFDDAYFKDVNGYNRLLLSKNFYKRFSNYRYILIHQLDAFVFKDELSYWCHQGYHYIGAPQVAHLNGPGEIQFLKGYSKVLNIINALFKTNYTVKNVGNGGFSLRHVTKCLGLMSLMHSKLKAWGNLNEDGFFKYAGNLLSPYFKLPTEDIALKFAVEINPQAAIASLNGSLPFGCHAFDKYEPEFWEKYIPGLKTEFANANQSARSN